ncbi:hypothetical protein FB45DRAFT_790024 [Roridomyces roridus]|uniref:CNH domain-containing protein n=1 Tax=Roridomyces roridus TaxID=1738132 RepID=A0AAD7BZ49_9AGAR|nr:hypothetical protein FB45DRAFT_790024 [Roridomyces roridus]
MTSAPTQPLEIPPFQLQTLIAQSQARCVQALGSEIYVGYSNGELIRFALQADDPNTLESYSIISRQSVPGDKAVEEIVLLPSISRALVLSDHRIHFYTLPALDVVPSQQPIRHVVAFAVDQNHLKRPVPSTPGSTIDGVDFCVIKRNAIAMYTLRERLFYQKEIPLPEGAILARRSDHYLCIADKTQYSIVDLANASMTALMPLSQAPGEGDASRMFPPGICVTGTDPTEFLILSWTGGSTIGVFISGEGDPVRGTLEWPAHPRAVVLDYPYIAALLPNKTVEIHSVESQAIVQVLSAPNDEAEPRLSLQAALHGYLVPSTQRSEKMRKVPVNLLRG